MVIFAVLPGRYPFNKATCFCSQALAKSQLPVEGARVLILNGSGAVGHLAVQLAKVHYGAHVTATTGPSNQELVSGLGADAVLDYTQAGWEEKLHGSQQQFDAIVDLVGGMQLTMLQRKRCVK